MSKHVIVIASGETERRSLPHLVTHLRAEDISVDEVRLPPRGRALTVEMAEKLVVFVDANSKAPDEVLCPLQEQLSGRLGPEIPATIQYAYAQWHLEAWYFADSANLRRYLGQAPGSVDTSKPDEIQNPKLHLKNLLGDRVYTAVISEEIAKRLNAQTIAQRSPSFQGFLDAVTNGNRATEVSGAHEATVCIALDGLWDRRTNV